MPHPYMVLWPHEFEERLLLPGKLTVIIPSSNAPTEFLVRAVYSVLMRSPGDLVEHIIVSLNGPDWRTGDQALCDEKQQFLDDLRRLKWRGRDMPLTVNRVWSRVGHAQAIEAVLPWVHTELYLLMHDDAVIVDRDWERCMRQRFSDPVVSLASPEPAVMAPLHLVAASAGQRLGMPYPRTDFVVCRKSHMTRAGANWIGYTGRAGMPTAELVDLSKLAEFYRAHRLWPQGRQPVMETGPGITEVGQDIGSWVLHKSFGGELEWRSLPASLVHHQPGTTWGDDVERLRQVKSEAASVFEELDREVARCDHRALNELYLRWRHTDDYRGAGFSLREFQRRAACVRSLEDAWNLACSFEGRGAVRRMSPEQVRSEALALAEMVQRLRAQTVLEIGTRRGGTLLLWCHAATENAVLLALDLYKEDLGGADRIAFCRHLARAAQRVIPIQAELRHAGTAELVRQTLEGRPLDFLFIDADHEYAFVRSDFETYAPLVHPGGLIALHDVLPPDAGPGRLWQELKSGLGQVPGMSEIVENPRQGWAGIGVIRTR